MARRVWARKRDDLDAIRAPREQPVMPRGEIDDAVVAAALAEAKAQRKAVQEAVWRNAERDRTPRRPSR